MHNLCQQFMMLSRRFATLNNLNLRLRCLCRDWQVLFISLAKRIHEQIEYRMNV